MRDLNFILRGKEPCINVVSHSGKSVTFAGPSPTRGQGSQGRNAVRWRPWQKTSLAPPWSNRRRMVDLSSFESKFTVLKKVLVTLFVFFDASRSN